MLVANSFVLWQRDTFFSAAEEVQRSADIMESAYRTWERQRIEGLKPTHLDELCRELQTALGTAKWQLEEFGKAVAESYRSREDDEITMARHKQFVDAIENQISRVETSLRKSFNEQGKTQLRWVNLDEQESDELAAFLSGPKKCVGKNFSLEKNTCLKMEHCNGTKTDFKREIFHHLKATDIDYEVDRTSGSTLTWSSSNRGEWEIIVNNEEDQNNGLAPTFENTPKDRGTKSVFWRQRSRDWFKANGVTLSCSRLRGIRWINLMLGSCGGCQRQLLAPLPSKLSSIRLKLFLMLTFFVIVPFLMYSA